MSEPIYSFPVGEVTAAGEVAVGFACREHNEWETDSLTEAARHQVQHGMEERDADHEWCRRCGGPNVIWSAASPLWNFVMRGNDINDLDGARFNDLVCMPCFILCATEAGLPERGWRLTLVPEPDGLIYETPSGRIWDAEKFLWVEGF